MAAHKTRRDHAYPRKRADTRWPLCAVIFSCSLLFAHAAGAQEGAGSPRRAEAGTIHDDLIVLSKSMGSVSFRSVETVKHLGNGKSRRETYEFARAQGGRSALVADFESGSVRTRVFDMREDGSRRFKLTYARNYPDVVSTLHIERPESTDTQYTSYMPHALWAIMPFGKTMGQLVEEGGRIGYPDTNPGHPVLTCAEADMRLEATLSSKDWLPEEVRLESPRGRMHLKVSKFTLADGRWFPLSGSGEEEEYRGMLAGKREFTFEVRDVSINRDLSDERFTQPQLPEGVVVFDRVENKTFVVGGDEARKRWERKYPQPEDKITQKPLVAEEPGHDWGWAAGWVAISLCSAVAATTIHLRRQS